MIHLEEEINQLKSEVIEMLSLTRNQLEKVKHAFLNHDSDLAEEITHNEKRVNAMELSIDRACENFLALYQPVATDLRFVIAVLKINSDIERIADLAYGIASYILELPKKFSNEAIEKTKIAEMFDINIAMLDAVLTAFENEDTKLARQVYKQDKKLNKINSSASKKIADILKESPEQTRQLLFLFSSIRKLERAGDHIKNITEDISFHIDAKVLKHKKSKKLIKEEK